MLVALNCLVSDFHLAKLSTSVCRSHTGCTYLGLTSYFIQIPLSYYKGFFIMATPTTD